MTSLQGWAFLGSSTWNCSVKSWMILAKRIQVNVPTTDKEMGLWQFPRRAEFLKLKLGLT